VLRSIAHFMSKVNWSCTSCGMSSARRTSVERHIINPNIHGGAARAVPFAEYSAGITSGKYKVGRKPSFAASEQPLLFRLVNKISVEFENEIAKEVAKRICKTLDDTFYNNVEAVARKHLWFKQFEESLG